MSNNNFPVNKNEDAVLVRGAKPDFIILSTDSKPTLAADEAGSILEESDTGQRFRWTSTRWVLDDSPRDFFVEVALGNIRRWDDDRITGRNFNIGNSVFETLWDQGGNYNYLSGATTLFASSSSAGDTATVLVSGLDINFDRINSQIALTGQTQVALPDQFFRVHTVLTLTGTLAGDVYIAETDAAPGGVPAAAKVQAKMPLTANDSGDFASNNISHNGFYTVPANFTLVSLIYLGTADKDCDITANLWVRADGGEWLSIFVNFAYQSIIQIELLNRGFISEKSDIQIRVLSGNPGGSYEANFQFLLKEDL